MSTPTPLRVAVILCGGQSRRMGIEKAQLRLGNRIFPQVIRDSLASVIDSFLLVGRSDQVVELIPPAEWLVDQNPDWGPLEGIATALEHLVGKATTAFITSCDSPLIRPALVRELFLRLGESDAVIPRSGPHPCPS